MTAPEPTMSTHVPVLAEPVTDEGRALVERLADHLPRISKEADEHDRTGTFPAEMFAILGEDGVLGGTVPTQLGGMGVSRLYDVAVALRLAAEADASTALALHAQFSRGLTFSYEWQHGGAHERALTERLLRLMAVGEPVCGGVKDHPSAVTELTPDGTGNWLLSGRKTLVTMAPIAKHVIVVAQTNVEDEPPRFATPVLARDTPGLTVLDDWDGLGMRASATVDIVFDECPVPASDVLLRGAVGARDDAALAGQTVSSITMLGIYLGIAAAARNLVVDTLGKRRSAAAGATRTLIAEIDARLFALCATVSAALVNADVAAATEDDVARRGRRMMVPFQHAKLMINQMVPAIVNDCMTVVGGAAYTMSHPMSRLYRDARAGAFMQPYTYADGVDFLSAQALGIDQESNYMNVRARRPIEKRY